jgi:lariat debranching enzyme
LQASDDLEQQNSEEIPLFDEELSGSPMLSTLPSKVTNFLALDKCLPQRQFLEVFHHYASFAALKSICQILDFSLESTTHAVTCPPRLTYDPEWLAITRTFHPYLSTKLAQPPFPDESQVRQLIKKELQWVEENVGKQDSVDGLVDILLCQQFTMTASGPGKEGENVHQQCVSLLPLLRACV